MDIRIFGAQRIMSIEKSIMENGNYMIEFSDGEYIRRCDEYKSAKLDAIATRDDDIAKLRNSLSSIREIVQFS
jgi:hypothetical protein